MSRRKRRRFTPEQKAQAVRILKESGKSIRQVAEELDLPASSLARWARQAEVDERRDPDGPLTTDEREELARLRRELRTVRQERDFLKKAAAFFAKETDS